MAVVIILTILLISYGVCCPNLSDDSKNTLLISGVLVGIIGTIGAIL